MREALLFGAAMAIGGSITIGVLSAIVKDGGEDLSTGQALGGLAVMLATPAVSYVAYKAMGGA